MESLPEEHTGQLKVRAAESNEEYVLDSINTINVKSWEGNNIRLKTLLPADKHHFVLFMGPFDCGWLKMLQTGKEFTGENPDFDLTVIMTHPYAEELKWLTKGLDLGTRIIPNTDSLLLHKLGVLTAPDILIVHRNGKIIGPSNKTQMTVKELKQYLRTIRSSLQ